MNKNSIPIPPELQLRYQFETLSAEKRRQFLEGLSEAERLHLLSSWWWMANTYQLPPMEWITGEKTTWVLRGGRGIGKTRVEAEMVAFWCHLLKDKARVLCCSITFEKDIVEVLYEGESGILNALARAGLEIETYRRNQAEIVLKNGAHITGRSSAKPRSPRGVNSNLLVCDEYPHWDKPEEFYSNAILGRRMKPYTRTIMGSTPLGTKFTRWVEDQDSVVKTGASLHANRHNLSEDYYKDVTAMYAGTRLEQQEIYGEILDDNPDALWQWDWIKRVDEKNIKNLDLTRIVVGVDPAVTSGDNSDETGIVVVGIDADKQLYILGDYTCKATPERWAAHVANVFARHEADCIVAEVNQGGDLVSTILRQHGGRLPVKKVRASRGKRVRAEPISLLYEQGRCYHVGHFKALEEQMCGFSPDRPDRFGSPDRVDALVWAATELISKKRPGMIIG